MPEVLPEKRVVMRVEVHVWIDDDTDVRDII